MCVMRVLNTSYIFFWSILGFGFISMLASICYSGDSKPNILVLFSDDQRWDAVGYSGNANILTPNLDRLAEKGTVFGRAYVASSVCVASRATLMTGQHLRRHNVRSFTQRLTDEQLAATYPSLLRDSGYYVGFIGKWGIGDTLENTAISARMFGYWAGASDQSNYWHERECPYVTNDGPGTEITNVCTCPPDARGVSGPGIRIGMENIKDPVHMTTYVIPRQVRSFLDKRNSKQPFCLTISFKDPHAPFQDYDRRYEDFYTDQGELAVAQEVIDQGVGNRSKVIEGSLGTRSGNKWAANRTALENMTRAYYRTCSTLDNSIGQVLQLLEEYGLNDNTVILFASDNGMLLGEHGLAGKWLMYEPSVRVPTIVYDPRILNRKHVRLSNELVQTQDLTATILDFADLPVSESVQGITLRPSLTDSDRKTRDYLFYEISNTFHGEIVPCTGLIGKRYKYIRYPDEQPVFEELFDLVSDPHELNNLASDPRFTELMGDLRSEWERQASDAK